MICAKPFLNKALSPDSVPAEALQQQANQIFTCRPALFIRDLDAHLADARRNHAERVKKVAIVREHLQNAITCQSLGSAVSEIGSLQERLHAEEDALDFWLAIVEGTKRLITIMQTQRGVLKPSGFIDPSTDAPRAGLPWRAL